METKTYLDVLLGEYKKWAADAGETSSPESMLRFLDKREALRPRADMPPMLFGDETYILSITLVTDGDFRCELDDPWLIFDEWEVYTLTKTWNTSNVEEVKSEACAFLEKMKANTKSHRDYVQEELDALFEDTIQSIRDRGTALGEVGGNYEGTQIIFFSGEPKCLSAARREVKTGLWASCKKDVEFVDELAKYPFANFFVSLEGGMSVFLHGMCGIFALALHDRLGYNLGWILDDEYEGENPWAHLVHLLCYQPDTEDGNPCTWIDVRGATDNYRDFCEEFEDFFDFPGTCVEPPDPDKVRETIISEVGETGFNLLYQEAKAFIGQHPDWYTIR